MFTLHLGPARTPASTERPPDFIRWWVFNIGGKLARLGSRSYGDDRWPDMASQRELEKAYNGQLVAMAIEPSYNHNGHYDPQGGFFWEDDYLAEAKKHEAHFGEPTAPSFVECPQCGELHTAPTRSCRGCNYHL